MVSLKALYSRIKADLAAANNGNDISEAGHEAQLILSRAVGCDYRFAVLRDPDVCASPQQEAQALEILRRRLLGEPLQYIFGEWDFYNLTFEVGEGVLIPRQDTETLVELAAENYLADGMVCADLCAGSGCIGICLGAQRRAQIYCYEKSPQAMEYLKRNIAKNSGSIKGSVTPVLADVLDERTAASQMFDMIVSNPPYLTAEEMGCLQRELCFEPEMALFGGNDGLDFYRAILRIWTKRLKSGGLFAVEIGETQAEAVSQMFAENGIHPKVVKDYGGNNRVVYGIKD